MSATSMFRNVCLRAYNGRYLTRLSGVKSNCDPCKCETVTRNFSTRRDRCAFRFCRRFMSHFRVRFTSIRPVCVCVKLCSLFRRYIGSVLKRYRSVPVDLLVFLKINLYVLMGLESTRHAVNSTRVELTRVSS